MQSYEIVLRGSEPVILISKADLESWIETMDVMSSPDEVKAIREGEKEEGGIELDEIMKKLHYKKSRYETNTKEKRGKRTGKITKK